MSEASRTRRSYDAIADRYAAELTAELQGKPLDRALLDAVAELAVGGPILDAGCGPGHVAGYLRARGADAVGMDLSQAMCAHASRAAVPAAVGDLARMPFRSGSLRAIACLYAVIHLDREQRLATYREFHRVLGSAGHALIAFHVSDAQAQAGSVREQLEMMGQPVELTFRFIEPEAETALLTACGFRDVARLDRAPLPGVEHPSRRSYLLVQRG